MDGGLRGDAAPLRGGQSFYCSLLMQAGSPSLASHAMPDLSQNRRWSWVSVTQYRDHLIFFWYPCTMPDPPQN